MEGFSALCVWRGGGGGVELCLEGLIHNGFMQAV